jgi:two-component system sensor histidine kinase UhpB
MTGPDALTFDDVPFRGIVEQSLAGVYVVLDERFMYANDTFAAMFGYPREEFIGRRMVDCVTPDSVEEVMRNYRLRISGAVPSIHYFTKGVRRDGRIVHLELHASRVECRGQPALAGVAIDITERVLQQEELRRSHAQLRELAQRINHAREAERAHLAREVHDVLGGMLTSAKFDLSRIVRRTAAPGQEDLHGIAIDLVALMQDTITAARTISEQLRPASLDLHGLPEALRQAAERFGARHGIAVAVDINAELRAPGGAAAVQIYRIVQEALTNVARHAGASHVELRALTQGEVFDLRVSDDGRGLDDAPRRPGAIGLVSMSERARDIGGQVSVTGRPEGGTQVVLRVPLT